MACKQYKDLVNLTKNQNNEIPTAWKQHTSSCASCRNDLNNILLDLKIEEILQSEIKSLTTAKKKIKLSFTKEDILRKIEQRSNNNILNRFKQFFSFNIDWRIYAPVTALLFLVVAISLNQYREDSLKSINEFEIKESASDIKVINKKRNKIVSKKNKKIATQSFRQKKKTIKAKKIIEKREEIIIESAVVAPQLESAINEEVMSDVNSRADTNTATNTGAGAPALKSLPQFKTSKQKISREDILWEKMKSGEASQIEQSELKKILIKKNDFHALKKYNTLLLKYYNKK